MRVLHREMAGPNRGGIRISELVTAMDFYPTFASILGQPLGDYPIRDGYDISPIGRANLSPITLRCLLLLLGRPASSYPCRRLKLR